MPSFLVEVYTTVVMEVLPSSLMHKQKAEKNMMFLKETIMK